MESLRQILPDLVLWGSVLSLVTVVGTIVAVPLVISRLPADYFSDPRRHPVREAAGPGILVLNGLRNLFGSCLLAIGIVLLFTPGQGLLTVLAGLMIMNFPGKYHLERAIVAREGVFRALNWFRRRHGHPPFEPPKPRSTRPD
jgi:hypothetical protein